MELTHRELEDRAGEKIAGTVEMVRLGDDLWHKLTDGRWERYPDYPAYPSEKNV